MYCQKNYQTKKAFKEDFKAGTQIQVFQPNLIGKPILTGNATIEGPHYPQAHTWYSSVVIANGVITKIRS